MHVYNDVAMQAVSVGFIIGVVQDSVETALNSNGDVFFTATAEEFDRKIRAAIDNRLKYEEDNMRGACAPRFGFK